VRGKIKNTLIISLIAWLFAASFAILPASSTTTATISAPEIIDINLGPGSIVPIDISVSDVEDLFGYQLVLSYESTLLAFDSVDSYSPFTVEWPMDSGPGYVYIAFSMPLGSKVGFTGSMPVATINMLVLDYGGTILDLHDTSLGDTKGNPMPHYVIDGFFSNVPVEYWFKIERAIADHTIWAEARDSTNTLLAKVKNKGSVATNVYLEFYFTDESGLMFAMVPSDTALIKPNQMHDFTFDFDRFWLIGHGAPIPAYEHFNVVVKVRYQVSATEWETARHIEKIAFTLYPDIPGHV